MLWTKTWCTGLLIAALAATGCSSDSVTKEDSAANGSHAKEAHSHGHGPNGGVVFDLGRHHAEFTVDHPTKQCQIVFLGADGKSSTPVAAQSLTLTTKETKTAEGTTVPSMMIELVPQDEQDGKATTFVGSDPGIGNVVDFDGTVLGMIDGKPSQGEFSESKGGHSHSH